ncbi:circularly permuted type 2 ATP-grasp protein [Jatrophihabitans telluris]|uniref:Circularly permuted type 2 ATP-grasp protein n=1 Tax=Jatrophihabitans telluris TaxID=2038343 RepID=A0ABY4R0B4_9ACTN|nr:circularly permuted type 2 ATP-grasp protein [Jatrophihabitans telluris]UQX89228.1 circularly permuted type 2 ATP-grasp protein [Jatrophihabitans telluris]
MADLFSNYSFGRAWDEMFASEGLTRPAYDAVVTALHSLDADELRARAEGLARSFLDRGVTFDVGGVESPFPTDLIPRIIEAAEWDVVSRGVSQRVKALEAFLADVYGDKNVVADGVVPQRVLLTSKYFERQAYGMEPANGVRIHVAGIDLIRDEQGRFRVLEDNVRIPSGVSYVLENRRASIQALPEVFGEVRARTVSDYPAKLLQALRRAAPAGITDPTVVLLTPGAYNAAYFEHTLLARTMGVELVEGRDLVCSNNQVRMRTTSGERPVHVIYRRVDDAFLDPVHFKPDSVLGCPGLLTAARAGNVTIANAVGNGVADDKLLYTYVPDLVRYYLREEPLIDNVDTFRLEQPDHLAEVIDRLDELVLKPVDGSGGKGIVIGPQADKAELEVLRAKVLEDPRGWIAQQVVHLSTVPTVIGEKIAPRHVDLRPFAVNDGEDVWVLPGGLTRVALPEGSLVVNSSQGGGSKDTLVIDRQWHSPQDDAASAIATDAEVGRPMPAPEELATGAFPVVRSMRTTESRVAERTQDVGPNNAQSQQQQQGQQ